MTNPQDTTSETHGDAVYLDGHLDVPEERRSEVMAALPFHVSLTLKEPGCVSFDVRPCPEVEGRLLVSEVFESQAAFDHHQQRTSGSRWAELTQGLPRNYSIRGGSPPNPSQS